MTRCFVGLGGNLDNPEQRIKTACDQLGAIRLCEPNNVSSLYVSEPLRGNTSANSDQPNYINAVVELSTQLSAEQLLDELQQIEQQHGRTRSHKRWQSRTLDLDILLFGDRQISSERLQIPHREMLNRNFVVFPLHEIAPDLVLPNGVSLEHAMEQSGLKPLRTICTRNHPNSDLPEAPSTPHQPSPSA